MTTIIQDIRYGIRTLASTPWSTMVAIISIAVVISANTTIFSWVQSVAVNPIQGVSQADRLVTIETITQSGQFIDASYPDFQDYRSGSETLADVAHFKEGALALGTIGSTERVWAEMVSGNLFTVLGVSPALGRFFSIEEQAETPGAYPVAVIGERFWRSRFDADPGIVGRTVILNRHEFTIIGVAPASFAGTIGGLRFDLWVPIMMRSVLMGSNDNWIRDRGDHSFHMIGRLASDAGIVQANAEIETQATSIASAYPTTHQGMSAAVLGLQDSPYGAQSLMSEMLYLLLGVVAVVLLIVCANVANLLLARTVNRRKELHIRFALGGTRRRIVRLIVTESLLIALAGGLCGVILAFWMIDLMTILIPASDMPVGLSLEVDGTILFYSLGITIVTGLIIGIVPALQATGGNVQEALKDSSRGSTGGTSIKWARSGLVVGEVAMASVALICAGLFAQSFQNARRADPGFDVDSVTLAGINMGAHGYDHREGLDFLRRLRTQLSSAPGISRVAFAESVPLGFDKGSWQEVSVDGYTPSAIENMKIYRNPITPGYFDVMSMSLTEGRDFTTQDDAENAQVIIVNEAFAARFLAGVSPIGHTVSWHGGTRRMRIIGIVKNVKYHQLTEAPLPFMYVPLAQFDRPGMSLTAHVQAALPPVQVIAAVKKEAYEIDPGVVVYESMPMAEWIGAAYFVQRTAAMLLSVMGGIALLLATIGLYSVLAYSVLQRTREIGIRMALGARPGSVLAMVLKQGVFLVAVGLVLGIAGSLVSASLLRSLLHGISATDPFTIVTVSVILAAVATLASYLPAHRAMRVDPMVALRYE